MPSLVPGFEYDIFISYRRRDNMLTHNYGDPAGKGWVSDFVDNLKKELQATFKEDISIYFDENPNDGLLETHDVDKTLEGKLKCLIFIPIISQTYCDPKSFAWQNEFCAFNKMTKEDRFGRNVKLRNGNVASRILPVKIHNIDVEDKALLESELGAVLRPVEFIYKSSGVNRPLRANEDHPQDNINKTYYLDQINKVANAIKEIISGLRKSKASENKFQTARVDNVESKRRSPSRKGITIASLSLLILFVAAYLIYSLDYRVFASGENLDKSIAVLPFENLSGDKEQEYFSDGMMQEIINQLVKIRQLSVTSLHTSMSYKDSKKPLRHIADELGVATLLEGRVQRSGDRVRIAVQLIDARTEKNLWSEIFVRDLSDIFSIQADISKNIARELKAVLSIHDVQNLSVVPTPSKEAYDYYLKSLYYQRKDDWINGIAMCDKAIALDPSFALAYALRSDWNGIHFFNKWPTWEGRDKLARADMTKAVELNPDLPEVRICRAVTLYHIERKYKDAIRVLSGLQRERPNDVEVYLWLSLIQRRQGLWREAIRNTEYAFSLDPNNTDLLNQAAMLHYVLHNYTKAIEFATKALSIDPEVPTATLYVYNSMLAHNGDVTAANRAITFNAASSGLESISDSMRLEWSRHYYNREFGELLLLISRGKDEIVEDESFYKPRSLSYAQIHYLNGDHDLTSQYGVKAMAVLRERLNQPEVDYRIYDALGYANAYAGNFKEAIAFGKKASDIMPLKLDAFSSGLVAEQSLAEIYIISGEYELALDRIEHLLSIPGNLSVPLLKIDPVYDNLRALPRFNKIINKTYKLNY